MKYLYGITISIMFSLGYYLCIYPEVSFETGLTVTLIYLSVLTGLNVFLSVLLSPKIMRYTVLFIALFTGLCFSYEVFHVGYMLAIFGMFLVILLGVDAMHMYLSTPLARLRQSIRRKDIITFTDLIYTFPDLNAVRLCGEPLSLYCYRKKFVRGYRLLYELGMRHYVEELELAIDRKDYAVVKMLLSREFKPTVHLQDESLPVIAVRSGDLELMSILLDHGASVDTIDSMGNALLAIAAERGDVPMVHFLLERGGNPNVNDAEHCPLLFTEDSDVVLEFLNHGADVDAVNDYGATLLMRSSLTGNMSLVRLAVEHGANVAAETLDGSTASTLALEGGHPSIAHYLAVHGEPDDCAPSVG